MNLKIEHTAFIPAAFFFTVFLAVLISLFFEKPEEIEHEEEIKKWCEEYHPNEPCSVADGAW